MQAESKAPAVGQHPHGHLRACVFPADTGHQGGALFRGQYVHINLTRVIPVRDHGKILKEYARCERA
jgi:hypothetical protein